MKHRVFVTAAAGDQGGAAARHLLKAGHEVIAHDVRSPDSDVARALTGLGASYVQGDLEDEASLDAAMRGASAVFAVPVGPVGDELAKVDNAARLIRAAERADIHNFIQTSTASAEYHIGVGDYGTGYTSDTYGISRVRIEALVRKSALLRWTILRPVALMENFKPPKSGGMFPWLKDLRLDAVHQEDALVQLVTVQDIARFAVAALAEPDRFDRETIDLSGDLLTLPQAAEALRAATQKPVTYRARTIQQAIADGMRPSVAQSQEWANQVGYRAPAPAVAADRWGIEMTPFSQWALDHANQLEIG